MLIKLEILLDKKGKVFIGKIIVFYSYFFRLTTQCEKCGQELYIGLQETTSNSCKCRKQQNKG